MAIVSKTIADFFSRIGGRSAPESNDAGGEAATSPDEPTHPTKALAKFLKVLQYRENPALVDLGPVVGTNVTFFGEQLGCRIRVEDVTVDIEQCVKEGRVDQLPALFASRWE